MTNDELSKVNRMWKIAIVAAALVCPFILNADAHQKQHGQLKIVHPHAMETASAQAEAVVMMTIVNSEENADALIGARTPIAESAVVVSNDAKSRQRIELPQNGSVELKTTGPHIALRALSKRLIGYDRFPLHLIFEKSGAVEVEVMVEERE